MGYATTKSCIVKMRNLNIMQCIDFGSPIDPKLEKKSLETGH